MKTRTKHKISPHPILAIAIVLCFADMSYGEMDHSKMGHSKMDHSKMERPADLGGMKENMPMTGGIKPPTGGVKSPSDDGGKLVIGRMKVTLMPEYDAPAIIVIKEGKFADRTAFPTEVNFTLPKGVTKLTDVCSLSPGGHHFCQLFDIKQGDDRNYLDVKLPFSDFFIDYQYTPFQVKENSMREFSFDVDTSYDINTLEIHVQRPLRADKFTITPAPMETYEKDGFKYLKYTYRKVKSGDLRQVTVSYFKKGAAPSVEKKFSAMKSPGMFEGSTGEILLVVGMVALGLAFYARRRKRAGR